MAPTGSEEIGWQELDDLSQLDAADTDREYSFEEADAATLAELGISPEEPVAAATTEAPAEEAKPRRGRASKADAEAPATDEAKPKRARTRKADASEAAGGEKPKRGTSRTKKADSGDGDEKPKRRARTAASESKSEASGEAGDGDEPQGIWGRFRSARKPRTTSS